MADKCHKCDNMSYDNCAACGQPTCRPHGRKVGDKFVCFDCINDYDEG